MLSRTCQSTVVLLVELLSDFNGDLPQHFITQFSDGAFVLGESVVAGDLVHRHAA